MTPPRGRGFPYKRLKRNRYAMLNLNRSFDKLRMTKSLLKCIKTIDTTLSFRAQSRNLLKTNPRGGLNLGQILILFTVHRSQLLPSRSELIFFICDP
jgi:hypothetical protein